MDNDVVTVIGGGLAGSEAAWQLAERGVDVRLFEMRPHKMTPAHHTGDLGELVCSNSLRGTAPSSAPGLLKSEMRGLGSMVMAAADETRVPAGSALAVDRALFARYITDRVSTHAHIELVREEAVALGDGVPTIVCTGPLTSERLEVELKRATGAESLYFFDAAAPIVAADSLDREQLYEASRYGKGEGVYLNCPMTREEYVIFREELCSALVAERKGFERGGEGFFSACMPIEELARKGEDTMRFGPLKPIGLTDPRTGRLPYAVVQLRAEDADGRLYNLVGFQTGLKWGEQKRVFAMIPALRRAEFLRYGVMHRNTFVDAPRVLDETLRLKGTKNIYLGGQITGTEGYLESAASGLLAALNVWATRAGSPAVVLPAETALGGLMRYLGTPTPDFQPMHVSMGLMPPLEGVRAGKGRRRELVADRAGAAFDEWVAARPDLRLPAASRSPLGGVVG